MYRYESLSALFFPIMGANNTIRMGPELLSYLLNVLKYNLNIKTQTYYKGLWKLHS